MGNRCKDQYPPDMIRPLLQETSYPVFNPELIASESVQNSHMGAACRLPSGKKSRQGFIP